MSKMDHDKWMEEAPYIAAMDSSGLDFRVSTDRYYSREFSENEKAQLWMKVWQIAGRADELPAAGDWMEYKLFDQSWIIVRGRDEVVRGFVNACRHRGNKLCEGKGQARHFLCPYHNWSYGLQGELVALSKPDYPGTIEEFAAPKEELGLLEVPVECFGGFVFINPDREAPPLREFLGEAADALAAYPLEKMVPVGINVRERIECNWKVILDAFGEGYHTQGVHKELVGVVDLKKERFNSFNDHGVSTTPFGAPGFDDFPVEKAIEIIKSIPTSHFPGMEDVLPRFSEKVEQYFEAGSYQLPDAETPKSILQSSVRETLSTYGVDVSALNDCQMIDYQFWLLFPNVFLQICAGEATVIIAEPDPEGNPNRCYWRVVTLQCLPGNQDDQRRAEFKEIAEGKHFPYFLALEQDFEQMAIQQGGLRNSTLKELILTKQEPRVAHFHSALNRWVQ